MKFGVNSVLFGGFDLETAFRCVSLAGYSGIELSAIDGMSEHLVLSRWRDLVNPISDLAEKYELELRAIEQPSLDLTTMEAAFAAASALGIPIVNCGPGGKSGDADSLQQAIATLKELAKIAEGYGVTLCVKAHVGAAIHDTPTTLQAMATIDSKAFGIDMDPSHILRAGEEPSEALRDVIGRVRHVHIRDCKRGIQGPGKPEEQANGRGDIDLSQFLGSLNTFGYAGPVDLEVIGAREYRLEQCCAIAAEALGHMRACAQRHRFEAFP